MNIDQEAEERQEALDAEKAQKEQLRLQEVGRSARVSLLAHRPYRTVI